MRRLVLVVTLLIITTLLVACERGAEDVVGTPVPLGTLVGGDGTIPTPTLSAEFPEGETDDGGFDVDIPVIATPQPFPSATPEGGATAPVGTQRFSNLRFAVSADGQGQGTFPSGTEEIYAIWDYTGMTANDKVERLWFLNNAEYVKREQQWAFETYGFTGTVRDIFLFDYMGGVEDGQWRVELYLNGELQLIGNYTVGSP